MKPTSLVIGMGIGQLYKSVLEKLGHNVITVDRDISKNANFPSVEPAFLLHGVFDTVHICTPNFTHHELALKVAPYAKIVFIEKPGVNNTAQWQMLCKSFPSTRFMMVKNNMWRSNIKEIMYSASVAKCVEIDWIRKNCIPSPGSWFTTRSLAFGGVSRDLMPHLLSLYIAINPEWQEEPANGFASLQNWQLSEIESTEYGTINPNGTYDVDDQCKVNFGTKWHCRANWRSMDVERSAITIIHQDHAKEIFELGWCPEDAYENMIKDAVTNLNNDVFWNNQYEQDCWIHSIVEKL